MPFHFITEFIDGARGEDSDTAISKAKLFVGFLVGVWLIFLGSLITLGIAERVIESVWKISIPNDLLYTSIGLSTIWFTIAVVGKKSTTKQN